MGKFKVGDKVRVVRADGAVGDLWVSGDADKGIRLGDIGVVKEEGDYSYFVAFNGVSLLMNHEQLELIKRHAAAAPKFKVGDPVRLLKDGLSTTGATGHTAVVMGLDMNGGLEVPGDIWVTIDGGQKPFKSCAVGGVDTRVDADGIELIKPAATNAKFKAGDRVVYRNYRHGVDMTGTVKSTTGDEVYCTDWSYGQPIGYIGVEYIELIPTTPAIVAVIENGTPKPNARPRIHDTEAAATTEAERLAVSNPGEKFGVFVMTTARVADVTVRVV